MYSETRQSAQKKKKKKRLVNHQWLAPAQKALAVLGLVFELMLCLEVWREMRVERRRVMERRVK